MVDGIDILRGKLSTLGNSPGVYRMLAEDGRVLYVGKAKNLLARVRQYTQPEGLSGRIRKMVFETRDLVVVETATEAEALLLEANLIKSLKPHYNIIFRDDASYVRVLITDEETPLIRSHRGAQTTKGTYFGPYPSAGAVYSTLTLMEKIFRLRTCPASTFAHRTRPCLKYDIKRCSAPCVGRISNPDYRASVAMAVRFLKGERQGVVRDLSARMEAASAALDFEGAALLRDQIAAISAVQKQDSIAHGLAHADVFALVQEAGRVAIQAFYYREGNHVSNHVFMLKPNEGDELSETMRLFLAVHYTGREVPPLVLVNLLPDDAVALEEALGLSAGRKVRLECPKQGDKRARVEQAERNALASLARKVAEEDGWREQMEAFGTILGRALESVECFDISNISGKFPVASQVVAGPDGMMKSRYKRYHIQVKNTPDDYAMMREVIRRRLVRGMKDGALPSVLLADGGKGQLGVLVDVARELGLWGTPRCPSLCGIAKGEERDKGLETLFEARPSAIEGGVEMVELPITYGTPLIFMLQRIRDEAHRFAITFHRAVRSKNVPRSKLDGIPGIGATKKKALLLHFGSAKGVEGASEGELAAVDGIGPALAAVVYGVLHGT